MHQYTISIGISCFSTFPYSKVVFPARFVTKTNEHRFRVGRSLKSFTPERRSPWESESSNSISLFQAFLNVRHTFPMSITPALRKLRGCASAAQVWVAEQFTKLLASSVASIFRNFAFRVRNTISFSGALWMKTRGLCLGKVIQFDWTFCSRMLL